MKVVQKKFWGFLGKKKSPKGFPWQNLFKDSLFSKPETFFPWGRKEFWKGKKPPKGPLAQGME